MECAVRILLGGTSASPTELVAAVRNHTDLPTISILSHDGHEIAQLRLREAKNLFSADVLQQSPSTSTPSSHCHYESRSGEGLSTLSLCHPDTLSGTIVDANDIYYLSARQTGFLLHTKHGHSCDFSQRAKRQARKTKQSVPAYYGQYLDGRWRYVELGLAADYSIYEKYGKDVKKVTDRLHAIANGVNSYYYPLNIRVTLVWIDVWSDGDKFDITTSGDKTLELFLNYRKTMLKQHPNDNAHLLTNVRFEAGVVGKAYKGTMCSYDYSVGVDVDHQDNAAAVASTMAHEMGHNFGMEHDVDKATCACPDVQCIMAPAAGHTPAITWSECSMKYLETSLRRQVDMCLHNVPETSGSAKCGNGIVEAGEECDCGRDECPHDCCDGKTCKLTENSECATGDCCDFATCKPKARATVCRSGTNLCDLPEFCNGESADCPADFYVQDGLECPGRKAEFCYEGVCGSRNDHCATIWGPTGYSSVPECYNTNMRGIFHGNCGYDVHTKTYDKCEREDVMCGRIQCDHKAERPYIGDPSSVSSAFTFIRRKDGVENACRVIQTTFVPTKGKPDPGMVLDGSKCGNDKICVNKKCTPLVNVTKTTSKCDENCNFRGVCNNMGNCHCDNGFGGLACEIPGYGGSVNSNQANLSRGVDVLWITLFFVILMLGTFIGVSIYMKRKKNVWLPAECWRMTRSKLNLHGVLVPTRRAPPPPNGRKKSSLNAVWGDSQVCEKEPLTQPPTVALPPPAVAYTVEGARVVALPPSHVTPIPPSIPIISMPHSTGNSPDPLLQQPKFAPYQEPYEPATAKFAPYHQPYEPVHVKELDYAVHEPPRDPAPPLPAVAPVSSSVSRSNSLSRPAQPPPKAPMRPPDNKMSALYEEKADELGIVKPSLTYSVGRNGSVKRSDSLTRPGVKPPPPPPKDFDRVPAEPTPSSVKSRAAMFERK